MKLAATFPVDHSADEMQIGITDNLRFVRAPAGALFHVSDGQMSLNKGMIPDADFAGTLKVSGTGQMFIKSIAVGVANFIPFPNTAQVEVEGGTLSIERAWQSHGGIEFSGGRTQSRISAVSTLGISV